MSHRVAIVAVVTGVLTLAGCQEVRIPGVYRIDIQQGNVITQAQLAALEKGMEKRKVRFILGTPLVADTFNQDRWDYYYSIEKRGEDRMQRIVSVFFEDERLDRVGGDVLAALGPIKVETRNDEVVAVPDGYRDDGLLASLTPQFLSRKVQPDEPAEAPGSDTSTTADEDPAASALQISEEDERYLRELLVGFGRGGAIAGATDTPDTTQTPLEEPLAEQTEQQENIFSRWARTLGIKDDEPAAPEPAPEPAPPAQ